MIKPKLALIPSGYKSGTVYSILPNDGTQDFSLDRTLEANRYNKDGLFELMPTDTVRLDYLKSDCPAILRESERTLRQIYSEDISNAVWTKVNITVTSNDLVAPNGEYIADKIQRTSTSGSYVTDAVSKSSAAQLDITTSMFIKKGEGDFFAIRQQGVYPNRGEVKYQFSTNTLTTSVAGSNFTAIRSSAEDYGNGWIRISATFNTDAHTQVGTLFSPRATDGTIDATDTSDSAYAYVWGIQVEEGVGSTSYVKTEDIPKTRDLDNLECTTTYTVGSEATWYFDFEAYSYDSSFRQLFLIRNGAFTQYLDLISYESGGTYYMRARATVNGGTQDYIIAFGEDAILNFTRNRVAIRLYGSNFEIYVNGTREYTGTASAGEWDVLNGLDIVNDFGASTTAPSYRLYDFRVYDQTMTQSELEELTTL